MSIVVQNLTNQDDWLLLVVPATPHGSSLPNMRTRLRHSILGGAITAATWVALGFAFIPSEDRGAWFALWTPLAVALAVLSDYFIWQNPKRLARREQERHRPGYGGVAR